MIKVRRWIGALCIALACLGFAQSTLVLFDRIEHGHELQHVPRSLAGTLIVDHLEADDHSSYPDYSAAHEHMNDGATTPLLPSVPSIESADYRQVANTPPTYRFTAFGSFTAPDRPPRASVLTSTSC